MHQRNLDQGAWVGAILLLTLLLGVFGLVKLLTRLSNRLSGTEGMRRLPSRMSEPVSLKVTAIFWTIFLGGVFTTLFFASRPVAPQPNSSSFWTWIGRLALVSAIVTTLRPVAARWSRRRDLAVVVTKRAKTGDVDGAIADLRAMIAARGPTAERSNALACLMMIKENWIDARKLLLEAEALSGDRLRYRGNMAQVLKNLGRTEDALACLEPLVDSPSASLADVCNSCDLLIDLDRLDAAWERIAKAEAMFKALTSYSPTDARRNRPILDACRERLETKLGGEKIKRNEEP